MLNEFPSSAEILSTAILPTFSILPSDTSRLVKVPLVPLTSPVNVPLTPLTSLVNIPFVALTLPVVVIPPPKFKFVNPETLPLASNVTLPIVPVLELILSDFNSLVKTVCETKRLPTKRLF